MKAELMKQTLSSLKLLTCRQKDAVLNFLFPFVAFYLLISTHLTIFDILYPFAHFILSALQSQIRTNSKSNAVSFLQLSRAVPPTGNTTKIKLSQILSPLPGKRG